MNKLGEQNVFKMNFIWFKCKNNQNKPNITKKLKKKKSKKKKNLN